MNAKAESREGRRSQINRIEYQGLRQALVDAMSRHNVGQRELSRRLNKPEVFVNRIVQGRRTVEFSELLELCEGIGVDPIEIFSAAVRFKPNNE